MRTIKDKKKFGWGKQPKNRRCKKFGCQRNRSFYDRQLIHTLLFHTEGWNTINVPLYIIRYIENFYNDIINNTNYYIEYYYVNPEEYYITEENKYFNTIINHCKELYNTLKERGDIQ